MTATGHDTRQMRGMDRCAKVCVGFQTEELAEGTTREEMTRECARILDDIRAVLRYAAEVMAGEKMQVAGQ